MTSLGLQIKKRIEEKNLTTSKLERLAGLKTSAVRNIITGASQQPSALTLKAIANVLGCSVDDLLENVPPSLSPMSLEKEKKIIPSPQVDEPELYIKAAEAIFNIIKSRGYRVNIEQVSMLIKEVYIFSSKKKLKSVDMEFVEWLIEDKLENTF